MKLEAISKTYDKSELIEALVAKGCEDALAKFPPAQDFEFRIQDNNDEHKIALRVGHRVTKKHKKVMEELWLEEAEANDVPSDYRAPVKYRGKVIGNAGSGGGFDNIHAPAYGAEAKCSRARNDKFIGLFYTLENGIAMNDKVCNSGSIKGEGVFGKLSKGVYLAPYSDQIKALFRFILIHCDHIDNWEEFENASGRITGINCLAMVLKKIAKHIPSDDFVGMEGTNEIEEMEHGDTEKEEETVLVPEGQNKKRPRDEGTETLSSKKKARVAGDLLL